MAPVVELLPAAGRVEQQRVFVLDAPATLTELRPWLYAPLPDGWEHDPRGDYLTDGGAWAARYVRRDAAGNVCQRVELLPAGAWWGDAPLSVEQAAQAWGLLNAGIAARWPGAVALSTPGTTGRDLVLRSLPDGAAFPVPDRDAAAAIRASTGQGRIELFPPAVEQLDALHVYDARLAYAACAWELGSGVVAWDDRPEVATRGRYRVTVTVPDGWDHVGLLGVHDDAGGWRWPNEPGERFQTWAEASELHLADAHGWRYEVHERIVYERGRPLDRWARQLVELRDSVTRSGVPVELHEPLRAAVRSILLHGIGAMHGAPRRVTRSVPVDQADAVPAGAAGVRVAGDALVYSVTEPPAWGDLAHPEWCAQVWARARVRLLDAPTGTATIRAGALNVARDSVVAMRTDALYLSRDPAWPDDGKVGRFRRAGHIAGPVPWPASNVELLRLRDGGE